MLRTIRGLMFAGLLWGMVGVPLSNLCADDPDRMNAKPAPALPVDRNLWLNSTPFTWEQLRGKAVYVFFFDCGPGGTVKLPDHVAAAKRHANDPVVFLGIAMGSSRQEAEAYLRPLGFTWPTLCDPYYTYTRLCDTAMELKDSNMLAECYCGVAYVTNDTKIVEGWFDEPEVTVKSALTDAAWTTSPQDIPEPILPIWRAIEFRKYSEAVPLLKKGLNAGSDDHKAAARKLQEVVLTEIERLAEEARAADQADQKWTAYRKVSRVLDEFRGYELPKDLEPLQKMLLRSSQVKAGQTAERQLGIAAQGLASPNPALRKRAQVQLEKIIEDFPDSDLAGNARKLIDDAPAAPKK